MNYTYKKIYNKNYLTLCDFEDNNANNDYSLEMIRRNPIEGLLDFQLSIEDNFPIYYYNISSMQSFHSCFYEKKLKKNVLFNFFSCLHLTLLTLNRFLLDYNHLVLLPQCIFCDKDIQAFKFVYCPQYHEDFFANLREFISYILTITDHDDEATVLISYALWQEVQTEHFNMQSLMNVIDKHFNTPTVKQENSNVISENNIQNSILKEPDVLLKENYSYEPIFIIKTAAIYGLSVLLLIVCIVTFILHLFSTETFFILLTSILIFVIFFTSKIIRTAPVHRIFNRQDDFCEEIIHVSTNVINTNVSFDTNENYETILLCEKVNNKPRYLVYSGIDFSQEVEISNFPFAIGKQEDNNLIVNNPAISRHHARITVENDIYYIEDLNSSNGTKVNDQIIPAYTPTEITSKDNITFAHLTYIFQ